MPRQCALAALAGYSSSRRYLAAEGGGTVQACTLSCSSLAAVHCSSRPGVDPIMMAQRLAALLFYRVRLYKPAMETRSCALVSTPEHLRVRMHVVCEGALAGPCAHAPCMPPRVGRLWSLLEWALAARSFYAATPWPAKNESPASLDFGKKFKCG